MFGGPKKKLEKRANASGTNPETAAQKVVRAVVVPYARSNGGVHVATQLESLRADECLRRFDKILSEVCQSIAAKRLAETGEGRIMANAYFNQAYGPLIDAVDRYAI